MAWTIGRTKRFAKDVAHHAPEAHRLDLWIDNISDDPFIGDAVEEERTLAVKDYDTGPFVIRYLLIPTLMHIELTNLYPKDHLPENDARRTQRARQALVDIATLLGGFKP